MSVVVYKNGSLQPIAGAVDNKRLDVLEQIFADNAGAHNCIYRGKFLGNAFIAEQSAAIREGTFRDLYIGDYWIINEITWRIMDFDYWYQNGDIACTQHHAIIVPDTPLYNARMNASNITTDGYVGSEMYTTNLEQAKTMAANAFGSNHILTHRELLCNGTTDYIASNWAWFDSTVELMNENMVYGSQIFSNSGNNVGNGKSQFAGFRFRHDLQHSRAQWYWLRDVASGGNFCDSANNGRPTSWSASVTGGVRPTFPIY